MVFFPQALYKFLDLRQFMGGPVQIDTGPGTEVNLGGGNHPVCLYLCVCTCMSVLARLCLMCFICDSLCLHFLLLSVFAFV